jgi:hypothetical protein
VSSRDADLREFSAPHYPQPMGFVQGSDQTLQDALDKMEFKDEDWDPYLPLAQHSYNTMKWLCIPSD